MQSLFNRLSYCENKAIEAVSRMQSELIGHTLPDRQSRE